MQSAASLLASRHAPYGPATTRPVLEPRASSLGPSARLTGAVSTDQTLASAVLALNKIADKLNAPTQAYADPFELLPEVEPSFRVVLKSWHKQFGQALRDYKSQLAIHSKYEEYHSARSLLKQFECIAKKKWQWTEAYAAVAKPLDNIRVDIDFHRRNSEMTHGPGHIVAYDIHAQFAQLCKQQALEQQEFVFAHQHQQFLLMKSQITREFQWQKLSDMYAQWKADVYGGEPPDDYSNIALRFLDCSFKSDFPKLQADINDDQKKMAKREKALLESRAKYDLLDINAVAAIAAMEAKHGSKARDNQKIQIPKGGLLEHLVSKNPVLASDFNFVVKDKHAKPSGSAQRSASKPRSRSSSVRSWHSGRSNKTVWSTSSRASSRPSSSKKVTISTPPAGKGASRGRGRARGRGRGKPRSSSGDNRSPGGGHKGQGKGKNKGKGTDIGKGGRGNSATNRR